MDEIVALLGSGEAWASLLTLTALEIVLGIDNIIFLSIVSQKLPPQQAKRARRLGLVLALAGRIGLLFSLTWIIGLTKPVFTLGEMDISWRDIVLFLGGFFLLAKGTMEIHHSVMGTEEDAVPRPGGGSAFLGVIVQILILDIVFSLDSVLTAVGMSDHLPIMITAVVIAIIVMLVAAEPLSAFVQKHPTVKMLALTFLILVGMVLVADGLHVHIPREYLYVAIAFSVSVEALNLWAAARRKRRRLQEATAQGADSAIRMEEKH